MNAGAMANGDTARRSLPTMSALALLAGIGVLWLTMHPGGGLRHDAVLYAIQGLAHLEPELFSGDLFLRYGSQDRFTLFGPLFKVSIELLGLETAARLLAALFQVAMFAAAGLLASTFMPARLAWLAVALLCALPSDYGARGIFELNENFVTPRGAAQALTLAGLAMLYRQRLWPAGLLLALATALHPLVALPGVLLVPFVQPHGRRVRNALLALGAGIALCVFAGLWLRGAQMRFDPAWLDLLRSGTPYLFVSLWSSADWTIAGFALVVPLVGAVILEDARVRQFCIGVVALAVAGFAVSWIGGDLLDTVLVVQVQPWRWIWLATALSPLLLPLTCITLWRRGALGQLAVAIGAAAWLLRAEPAGLPLLSAAAIPALMTATRWRIPPHLVRMVGFAGIAILACAVVILVSSVIQLLGTMPELRFGSQLIRTLRETGALVAALFCGFWWFVVRGSRLVPLAAVAACAAFALVAVAGIAEAATADRVQRADHAAFQTWRDHIPPRSEVLWFDEPLACWRLLERPNFASNQQAASALFSRQAAMETYRRLESLRILLPDDSVAWRTLRKAPAPPENVTLAAVCASSDVRYIVTREDLGPPLSRAPERASARYRTLGLYACPSNLIQTTSP